MILLSLKLLLLVFFLLLFKRIIIEIIQLYYVFKIPGPPKHSLFYGNLPGVFNSTPEQAFQLLRKFGQDHFPLYKLWIGPLCSVNLLNPEDIGIVFNDVDHASKSSIYYMLHRWLGTGLLTSNGTKWVQRRKLLTPTFHFNILQQFLVTFNQRSEELVKILLSEAEKPFTQINDLITSSTLKIIAETAMGKKLEFRDGKEKIYKTALQELDKIYHTRMCKPYLLFDGFYIWNRMFYQERGLIKILHDFTAQVVKEKEQEFLASKLDKKKKKLAMLDLLLNIKHQEDAIDNDGIREEVDTFMFEGHDTVSTALIFGLMVLADHTKVQQEMVEEIFEVLGNKQPSFNDFQELKYMDRCIKEILRLYPSVAFISRQLGKDTVFQNKYHVKKGTIVHVHIYDLHHNPNVYPDPEKFDPDRFLPENCKDRHPFAYIPFSGGPRNCIGQRFALLEIKALFCAILRNFVLEPVEGPKLELIQGLVLRSKQPVKIKFLHRLKQ